MNIRILSKIIYILLFSTITNIAISQTNYCVIFHHYNGKSDTIIVSSNEKLNPTDIPTSASCDTTNYPHFIGWTNDKYHAHNPTKPNIINENSQIEYDLNLYPVFSTHPDSDNNEWKLLKNTSNLKVGDKIIIVASEYDYALSTNQNTNDRGRAKITKNNNDSTITFNEDSQIITIENGTKTSTFAFNTNNGYLYAASNSNNHLKTKKDLDDNASWQITIHNDTAKIIAQGNYSRNVLRYNNASKIFSCYNAQKGNIFIYKKTSQQDTPQYTICAKTISAKFHTNGLGIKTINNIISGCKITEVIGIPTNLNPLNDEFMHFVGWTTSSSQTNPYTKPEIITTITQSVDLYPVFSDEHGVLIDNISSLSIGEQIIIAATNYNYAMSIEQKDNSRGITVIIKKDNKIILNDSVQIITLEQGTKENTFALNVSNGYLYASSSVAPHLKTTTNISDNTSWSISSLSTKETQIKAQGTNSYNIIRYNHLHSQFSCYENNKEKSISIYKKTDATKWTIYGNTNTRIGYNDTLNITENQAVNQLTIESYQDSIGTLNINNNTLYANKFILEKSIDNSHCFFFSLPFNCNISDIITTNNNGDTLQYATDSTNGDYTIKYFDQIAITNNKNLSINNILKQLPETTYTLQANQGYIIEYFGQGNATIQFPSTSNITIQAPDTATLQQKDYTWFTQSEKESTNGWNLIGSPYYTNLYKISLSHNNTEIPYITIPNPDGQTYTQTFTYDAHILPFSSFFVQLSSNHAPKFTLNNSNISTTNRVSIKLSNLNGDADKTTIINNTNSTSDYEIGKDLAKWIGYANIPQIYTIQNEEIFAFNSSPINESTIIDLGIYTPSEGKYTFSLDDNTIQYNIILTDKETQTATELTNNTYTTTLSKGSHNNRFQICFNPKITTTYTPLQNNISAWLKNNTIYINGELNNATIYIYDSVGHLLHKSQNTSTPFNYQLKHKGLYFIKIETNKTYNIVKIIY